MKCTFTLKLGTVSVHLIVKAFFNICVESISSFMPRKIDNLFTSRDDTHFHIVHFLLKCTIYLFNIYFSNRIKYIYF